MEFFLYYLSLVCGLCGADTYLITFFHTLCDVSHELPGLYIAIYGLGNILLQALNWFWFGKMIASLQKRFKGASKNTILPSEKAKG